MNYSKWKINFQFTSIWYQFYILPTIKITYNKMLFGFYNIEFWWGQWGFEIIFSKKD
jgi:hypothetical protein